MHIFNRVKHQTPESVELEFILAGIGSRAWALLIDYLILWLFLILFFVAWVAIVGQLMELFDNRDIFLWLYAIFLIVNYFIYTGYFVFFETLWQGQSPGKRIAKIRVIRDDGRPVGLQQAVLRALLRPIDDTFFLGAFFILFNRKEKRLGDILAGTLVIQTQPPASKKATLSLSEEAQPLAKELLQIGDFSKMLPDDFAIIREYLQRRGKMTAKARAKLSLELEKQVQAVLNIEQLPAPASSDIFLEAVYLAYQQQSTDFSY
ncbi:MAG: RDD family protein [Calothrix sp. MO_192.B10]|nr:RDD family protein [Calothrix sp. MO_192.B10]